MSQRDGFTGGFLAGALIGGLVGGVVGALAASRRSPEERRNDTSLEANPTDNPDLPLEGARRSLESKIAQLNLAIDDVRQQLGSVNGKSVEIDTDSREH